MTARHSPRTMSSSRCDILKEKGHPLIGQSLRDFAGATADNDATVTVRFAPKRARDVPLFVAGLPIFSRAYYTSGHSTNPASTSRSAPAPTRSAASTPAATSNTSGSKTGGAPICRSGAARTISTSCASNIIATATSALKAFRPAPICSARSSPRASGRPATIFRQSRMAASSATRYPMTRRPARKAGSSIRGGRNSPMFGCAKRSTTRSISSGPTRRSCTTLICERFRYFKIRI